MSRRLRNNIGWLLVAGLLGGGLAVARAEPVDPTPNYVKFEPIIVPVFIDNRSAGLLSVQVQLDPREDGDRALIEASRPRLIDAYTHALIDHARLYVDPLAPIDVDALARRLGAATDATLDMATPRLLVIEAMAQPA